MNRSIGVVAALCAVVSGWAQSDLDPNRVVASVNGEEIKGAEYYYRMEFMPGVGKVMGTQLVQFPPGFLALEQMISERLVFQLAKQQGVYPTDMAVQDELASEIRRAPSLVENWTATGRTTDELKYQVRYDLAKFNIETAGVTITYQEVNTYYAKNPVMFTTPKQVKLKTIVVRSVDDEAAVDKDLQAGKSFADAAAAHSQDASANFGGDYGTVPVDSLGPNVHAAIDKIKIGESTAWIPSDNKQTEQIFAKFQLEDVIAPKLLPLDTELRSQIRKTMMLQRGAIKNDIGKEMATMRAQAKIDIKIKTFADAYKHFIAGYLKSTGTP